MKLVRRRHTKPGHPSALVEYQRPRRLLATARTTIYLHAHWLQRYRSEFPPQETLSGLVATALEARLDYPEVWAELVRKVKGTPAHT